MSTRKTGVTRRSALRPSNIIGAVGVGGFVVFVILALVLNLGLLALGVWAVLEIVPALVEALGNVG